MSFMIIKSSWKKFLFCCFSVAVFSPLTSCKKDNPGDVVAINKSDEVPKDIISKLQEAGFDTSEGLRKFQNGYLVEYDILFTAEQINELSANGPLVSIPNGRVEHYRTNKLVVATPRVLQVFMDTGFGSFMQNAFDDALARYNNQNIGLSFQRTTNSANADIRIVSFFENSLTLGVSGGNPSNGNPATTIQLNTFYYNNTTTRPDAATTIAHEIGHAIGFRHTDFMDRRFSCGNEGFDPNEGNGDNGAVHIPGTPTNAVGNSWMLACSNNTNRPFTNQDIIALTTLYPVKVTPVGFQSVYRYYSGSNGDHFYTGNWGELGKGNSTYTLEGIEFYIASTQAYAPAPVYRYRSTTNNYHLYTTNWAELGNGSNGYVSEGILGYAFGNQVPGTVPIYRYRNTKNGDHFYTQVQMNYSDLVSEGIAFYTFGYQY